MTDRRDLPRLAAAAVGLAALAALAAPRAAGAAEGVIYSGSAYVDYWGFPDDKKAAAASPQGIAPMASIRIGLDVNDELAFTAKACISCHGIDFENVSLDYQPKSWFNVQFGRLALPFGEFSNRVDPGSYKTASPPLVYDMGRMAYGGRSAMNLGVLPLPYVDTGVLVYGVRWLGEKIQVWYGVYGVAGLRGSNDVDWMAMRSLPYNDNNRVPAGGGRLALAYSSDPGAFFGDANLGASYTAGRYDKEATRAYEVWSVDATLRLAKLLVRGEYASRKTDLDEAATGYPYALVDPWFQKNGFYAEAELPLGGYVSAVYRYDELHRTGTPLPGSAPELTTDSTFVRHTGGLVVTPANALYLKLSWELWQTTDFGDFQTYHVGIGGAF
jgi:cytochrome c553